MSMEAMSVLTAKAPSRVISKCLRIVELLLSKPQSREQLLNPLTLAIELLSVLHRVILTRDGELHSMKQELLYRFLYFPRNRRISSRELASVAPDAGSADVGDFGHGNPSVSSADAWCSSASQTLEELTAFL
ncbi:unnamed protein product, partial [Dibothriocephalus latus]